MFFFNVLTLFRSIPLPSVSGILLGDWMVPEVESAEGGGWDSLVGWPAVCQQSAEASGERPIISLTHTFSCLSPPKTCEIRQTVSAKTITHLYIHACGIPLHTPTLIPTHIPILSAALGVIFLSVPAVFSAHSQRAQEPSCHVSLLLTHRTKQFIRAWVESSLHTVLSVSSCCAIGWAPLTAGRIWAISRKDLLALPADLWPASAYACNSLWHFISSLVTVFIVYYHNVNNNDEVIIKSEAIRSFCFPPCANVHWLNLWETADKWRFFLFLLRGGGLERAGGGSRGESSQVSPGEMDDSYTILRPINCHSSCWFNLLTLPLLCCLSYHFRKRGPHLCM